MGLLDKVLGAGSVLQALGIDLLQFRNGQDNGRLIIIGAGHAASFMVSGSSRPGSRGKVRRLLRPPAFGRRGRVPWWFSLFPAPDSTPA